MAFRSKRAWALWLGLALAGCATGPRFDTHGVDNSITPSSAARDIKAVRGYSVLWGGVILTSFNLKDATQFEILGYPLDSSQRPNTDAAPIGRFLVVKDGYLETADYAGGRLLTVVGTLQDMRTGQIGEASYAYPIVQPHGLYLWPHGERMEEPEVRFGIGVSITR